MSDTKNVVVTGGTSGIGLGIARAFAAEGAAVTVLGRSKERGAEAVRGVEGLTFARCDVRDADALTAALAPVGAIDVLVNAAAGNFPGPAASLSPGGFRAVVDIDLVGTFQASRAAFASLRRPGALVLNISAPQAFVPTPLQAHACAAKAGVEMLTRCLALEWGPLGVRVVGLVPGAVADTEGFRRLLGSPEAEGRLRETIPLRAFSSVDEVATTALWLASGAAPSLTGTSLVLDGGLSLAGGMAYARALGAVP